MKKYNYHDEKLNLDFYKVIENGKTVYKRQYSLKGLGNKKRLVSPGCSTPKKCIDWINAERAKSPSERTLLSKKHDLHTFRQIFNECFAIEVQTYKRDNKAPTSLQRFDGIIKNYVFSEDTPYNTIADLYVENISVQDYRNFKEQINNAYADIKSEKTMRLVFMYIDKVFKYARDKGYTVKFNNNEIAIKPSGVKPNKINEVRNFLSFSEYQQFRKAYNEIARTYFIKNMTISLKSKTKGISKDMDFIVQYREVLYRTFFSCLFFTSSRISECRALKWNDILEPASNDDLALIRFDKQYTEKAKHYTDTTELRNQKSKSSNRLVAMNEYLKDDLDSLKSFLVMNNIFHKDEFIFIDFYCEEAKPIPPSNLTRCFRTIIDNMKIEDTSPLINNVKRHITIHGFRHSTCTYFLSLGMKKYDIASYLGHANTKMIEECYAHYINPTQQEDDKKKRNNQFFKKSDAILI